MEKELSIKEYDELQLKLKARFERNMIRHQDLNWANVEVKLKLKNSKLWSINEMENTGGEPDIVGFDESTNEYIFMDCSMETPIGRRNICYDSEGQKKREKQGLKPNGNIIDMAASMGIEPLTEEQYLALQKLGNFDLKTQSWLKTPDDIIKLGGAIFANFHYGRVFIYYNTPQSFYSNRAFRALLKV